MSKFGGSIPYLHEPNLQNHRRKHPNRPGISKNEHFSRLVCLAFMWRLRGVYVAFTWVVQATGKISKDRPSHLVYLNSYSMRFSPVRIKPHRSIPVCRFWQSAAYRSVGNADVRLIFREFVELAVSISRVHSSLRLFVCSSASSARPRSLFPRSSFHPFVTWTHRRMIGGTRRRQRRL